MSHVFGVWIVGFSDRVKEDFVDILLSSVFDVFEEFIVPPSQDLRP
jgi:hypothetical protein